MSDDIWNRLKAKPSNDSNQPKKSSHISWKSTTAPKASNKISEPKLDLFSIWDSQRQIEIEDKKMAQELAETKKKAKELQKTLRKHQYGETKIKLGSKSRNIVSKSKSHFSKTTTKVVTHKKRLSVVGVVAVALILVFSIVTNKESITDTLGESTSTIPITDELPRESPQFAILYPANKSAEDYDTVRISPDGVAPSYTYLDKFTDDGQIFKVTQQEVPENFDLSKVATDFQATNTIQIDNNIIYHGYSEKGGIQSILFIKEDKLVSIRSPQKFSDDLWASYVISMN